MKKEKEQAESKCKSVGKELETTSKKLSTEKSTVQKLRKEIEALNAMNGDSGKQVSELQAQLAKVNTNLEKTMKEFEGHRKESAAQVAELEAKLADLKKRHDEALAKKQKELDSMLDDLQKNSKSELAKLQKELEDLRASSAAELSTVKKEMSDKRLADLNEQEKSLTKKLTESFTKKIDALQEKLDKANKSKSTATKS